MNGRVAKRLRKEAGYHYKDSPHRKWFYDAFKRFFYGKPVLVPVLNPRGGGEDE